MIYITGDIHGDIDIRKLNYKNFPDQRTLSRLDYVIICGDFGFPWGYQNRTGENAEDSYWLNWLDRKPFTTLFIDGNHECISKESDVLTEHGWLNIEEAYSSNYKIANYDIKTSLIKFH